MDYMVFEKEWNELTDTLLEQGIVIQCFYVHPNLMPNESRRVVFDGRRRTTPVESSPWMMDRKYAFEAFRNECVGVDDNDDSQGVPVLRGDEEHQEIGREVGDSDS